MEPYIEPHQRAGYLKFVVVFFVTAYFVKELWGFLLGFLYGNEPCSGVAKEVQ